MNRVVHFEIPAEDVNRALDFYQKAFGWEMPEFPGGPAYYLANTGPKEQPGINGAIMQRMAPGQPITTIIDVESLDAALERIQSLGAKVVVPKTAVPGVGYRAYFQDTEGNILGLWEQNTAAR